MIDKANVYTDIGGNVTLKVFDTPNQDCTDQIKERVEYFLSMAGVHDALTITVHECDDDY